MTENSTIVPFAYKKVIFVPPKLLISFHVFQAALFATSVTVYIILCFVVIRHSPKAMGAYRWYIVWNATCGICIGFIFVLFQPEPLLPYTLIICRGIASIIELPHTVNSLFVCLIIIFIGSTTYTTTCMFIFRCVQTTSSRYTKHFESMTNYALCYLIFCLCMSVLILYPLCLQLLSTEELRASVYGVNNEVYEHMQGNFTVIGVNVESGDYYKIAGVSALIMFSINVTLIFSSTATTYVAMYKNRAKIYGKTAKLYKSLMMMLLFDVLAAMLTVFIPVFIVVIGLINNSEWGSLALSITIMIADTYPLTVNLLVLFYIEPYRKRVLSLFGLQRTKTLAVRPIASAFTSSALNGRRKSLKTQILKLQWIQSIWRQDK